MSEEDLQAEFEFETRMRRLADAMDVAREMATESTPPGEDEP